MNGYFCYIMIKIILNNRNKRKIATDEECDEQNVSDNEFCSDDSDYDSSSDESSDESYIEDINPPRAAPRKTTQTVQWEEVSSKFTPRKVLPEMKEAVSNIDEDCSITDVFLKLFPRSLFIWISDCTNERLQILSDKQGKLVKPTDPDEIMIVVGCLLIMSYNRVPHMKMYWSNNKSVRNDTIANAISRNRFMLLHSKLYFNHPAKPKAANKSYYTAEIIECLRYTFNRYRSEATHQSVDEFMVKFKGRSSMKQFLPQKPVKRGMKGFSRADACTGYTYEFFVYEGKGTDTDEGTIGEWVVNTLCSTIRAPDVAIVMDRFFTSVTLLQTSAYACVGTVQSSRRNLPEMKEKVPRGQSVVKCCGSGLICYKWQDTKEVMLLSNCHDHEIGTTERRLKDGVKKTFDCPEAINFYNGFMAGVDKSDQYSTCYEIDRKSTKWWKRVFYRLLLMAVTNSWIIYKSFRLKKMPLIDFLMPVSEELIRIGKGKAKIQRKATIEKPSKKMKMVNIDHQPLKRNTMRRCSQCSKTKIQSRTLYICSTCDVPLCVDCFAPYHGCEV